MKLKNILMAWGTLCHSGAVLAQQPAGMDAGGAVRAAFAEVAENVSKSAALVPVDKYNYRPSPSVRTFAQQIAHIADSHNYYCARAAGRNVQWTDAVEKGSLDKATLLQKLKQSNDACTAAYASQFSPPMVSNIGHTNLHYGNIITYLRMMGITPPSS